MIVPDPAQLLQGSTCEGPVVGLEINTLPLPLQTPHVASIMIILN
jgi:hypothetical protein